MSPSGSGPDLFNELAHEFAERFRRGERPAIAEYAAKYPALAEQIQELFPALAVMEEFGSAAEPVTGPPTSNASHAMPERLGEYRILREVARGGMGIVYEAVQESLGRHVALKVLPDRGLGNAQQLERFRREAKAAAQLHHTNIVPVFGVGIHEGVHYYAMQFIHGQSLDSVLAEVKRLREQKTAPVEQPPREVPALAGSVAQGLVSGRFPAKHSAIASPAGPPTKDELHSNPEASQSRSNDTLQDRLGSSSTIIGQSEGQYFRSVARIGSEVAEALAHAHQQGVVHRDVKPSNLLLDTQGNVWITDFGLAKSEGMEDLTSPGDVVGTLRYLAPERFEGQADARSDLYSLGLTLYEMLTLQPAFQATKRLELIEKVLHEEPARPRKLDPRIPRDLETIVLKAIAKIPAQRYQTGTALAEDPHRYLSDRPIQARHSTWAERSWRWCRRNPRVAGLLTTVAVLLVSVAVVSTAAAFRVTEARDHEREERLRADDNLENAWWAVDKYLHKVTNDPKLKQADFHKLRRDLLSAALPFMETLVKQRHDDPRFERIRARSYRSLTLIRWTIGEHGPALAECEQAMSIFRGLVAAQPHNTDHRLELGSCYNDRGNVLRETGRFDEAEIAFREALNIKLQLHMEFPNSPEFRHELGIQQNNLALLFAQTRRPKEAEAMYRDALQVLQPLVAEFPKSVEYRRMLAGAHANFGLLLSQLGETSAEEQLREALNVFRFIAEASPASPEDQRQLATMHVNLGLILKDTGRVPQAISTFGEALALYESLIERFPSMPDYQSELGATFNNLAMARQLQGELAEAHRLVERAIAHQRAALKVNPRHPIYREFLSNHQVVLVEVLLLRKQPAEAAAAALELARVRPENAEDAFDASGFLARCSPLVQQDQNTPPTKRGELAQQYADQAMNLLREALRRGYKDIAQIKTSAALAALRSRPDFQSLLTELNTKP
jgi:serine/threonine protein kinase/Flp pilus assembly protein TadD